MATTGTFVPTKISGQFTASGGTAPYTFTYSGTTAVKGIVFNADGTFSGTVDGTPVTTSFSVTATDSYGFSSTTTVSYITTSSSSGANVLGSPIATSVAGIPTAIAGAGGGPVVLFAPTTLVTPVIVTPTATNQGTISANNILATTAVATPTPAAPVATVTAGSPIVIAGGGNNLTGIPKSTKPL